MIQIKPDSPDTGVDLWGKRVGTCCGVVVRVVPVLLHVDDIVYTNEQLVRRLLADFGTELPSA